MLAVKKLRNTERPHHYPFSQRVNASIISFIHQVAVEQKRAPPGGEAGGASLRDVAKTSTARRGGGDKQSGSASGLPDKSVLPMKPSINQATKDFQSDLRKLTSSDDAAKRRR